MFNDKYVWNKFNSLEDDIIMTVAMPILNGQVIVWLALDSLKKQININFKWELIIMEEYGLSRDIIKTYENKLPGCSRIVHKGFDPKEIGIKKGKHKGKFPLISKWIWIAQNTSENSEVFVLQAVDCYSSPKRLFIHNEHFKNNNCIFSSQPKGIFYNILTNETILYSASNDYKSKTHLNMALRTPQIKKFVHKNSPVFNKNIDRHLIDCILNGIGQKNLNNNNHYFDNSIDEDNWKYSLDTDGFNNISMGRRDVYKIINQKNTNIKLHPHMDLWKSAKDHDLNLYIPSEVLQKLDDLKTTEHFINRELKRKEHFYKTKKHEKTILVIILCLLLVYLYIKYFTNYKI